MHEDCYFFMDMRQPEDIRSMACLCIKCHDEKHPNLGWSWAGTIRGYGPFLYKCSECDKIIYDGRPPVRSIPEYEAVV